MFIESKIISDFPNYTINIIGEVHNKYGKKIKPIIIDGKRKVVFLRLNNKYHKVSLFKIYLKEYPNSDNRCLIFNETSKDLAGEVWKILENYPKYEISNYGRLRNNFGKILKPIGSYYQIRNQTNQSYKCLSIGRLVAENFVENNDNHKFYIYLNSKESHLKYHYSNIKWVDNSDYVDFKIKEYYHYSKKTISIEDIENDLEDLNFYLNYRKFKENRNIEKLVKKYEQLVKIIIKSYRIKDKYINEELEQDSIYKFIIAISRGIIEVRSIKSYLVSIVKNVVMQYFKYKREHISIIEKDYDFELN